MDTTTDALIRDLQKTADSDLLPTSANELINTYRAITADAHSEAGRALLRQAPVILEDNEEGNDSEYEIGFDQLVYELFLQAGQNLITEDQYGD